MRWLTCKRRPHVSLWKNHILIAYFNIKCRGTHYIFNYDIIIGWNLVLFLLSIEIHSPEAFGRGNHDWTRAPTFTAHCILAE